MSALIVACIALGFLSMFVMWMLLRAHEREEHMAAILDDMIERAEEHIESWHPEWLDAEDENHAQTN